MRLVLVIMVKVITIFATSARQQSVSCRSGSTAPTGNALLNRISSGVAKSALDVRVALSSPTDGISQYKLQGI